MSDPFGVLDAFDLGGRRKKARLGCGHWARGPAYCICFSTSISTWSMASTRMRPSRGYSRSRMT